MAAIKPSVIRLEDSKRPALVKTTIGGQPEFVVVGLGPGPTPEERWLGYVFSTFQFIDMTGPVGLQQKYEDLAALSFGAAFTVTPDYAGRIEIDEGPLFTTPGSMVRAKDDDYIVFQDASSNHRGLSVVNHRVVSSQRGRPRFAFASWSLTLNGDDKPLLTHTVPDPAK
ncbi:hypothetical protein QCM77_44735 [Bradyrhizobium sp. SSUT18]|uniref:hypothetical protein n=1 Tax=Bradyrhizobium sp. SSUT18 TaxID=3040602 RepID=UPI002448D807|nr:hypothetical protein [Bradyrhizobium sp. SSUT18]MDH2406888.1 hypothetical protein [Bradyrhizobium sp. SSUT18]